MAVLQVLKIDTTIGEQLDKIMEEAKEIVSAVEDEESIERQLEECLDTIQATITLMSKIGTKEQIKEAVEQLHIKMHRRDYEFESLIKVEFM